MRQSRDLAGKTQREAANELGVTERTINRWEKGQYEPSITDVADWATMTRTSMDWLAGVKDAPPPLSDDMLYKLRDVMNNHVAALDELVRQP